MGARAGLAVALAAALLLGCSDYEEDEMAGAPVMSFPQPQEPDQDAIDLAMRMMRCDFFMEQINADCFAIGCIGFCDPPPPYCGAVVCGLLADVLQLPGLQAPEVPARPPHEDIAREPGTEPARP